MPSQRVLVSLNFLLLCELLMVRDMPAGRSSEEGFHLSDLLFVLIFWIFFEFHIDFVSDIGQNV